MTATETGPFAPAVGLVVLAEITAIGGGVMRDLGIGAVPPAAFASASYVAIPFMAAVLTYFFYRLRVPRLGRRTGQDCAALRTTGRDGMTIWGLLSDIHGNLAKLERALAECRARGAERVAVLGDNLGRGDPDACVALVRSLAEVSVVGNRDLDWADRVGADARAYVLGLPRAVRADDFVAVHGDARLDHEVSSADVKGGFVRTRRRLEREGARLALFGHTHRARVWRLAPDGASCLLYDAASDLHSARVDVTGGPGDRFVLNVGTVGLPFPGKGPTSCMVYDSAARTVEVVPLP